MGNKTKVSPQVAARIKERVVTWRVTLPIGLKPVVLELLKAFKGPVFEDIEMTLATRHAKRLSQSHARVLRYRERKAAKAQ